MTRSQRGSRTHGFTVGRAHEGEDTDMVGEIIQGQRLCPKDNVNVCGNI